jgi:hypothetical protein
MGISLGALDKRPIVSYLEITVLLYLEKAFRRRRGGYDWPSQTLTCEMNPHQDQEIKPSLRDGLIFLAYSRQ